MRIFYCGLEYDHYDAKRGLSFEHNNFYLSLARYPGAEVRYFKFDEIPTIGRRAWNEKLLAEVRAEKPDLAFFFMYSDELDRDTLEELKKYTKTIAWFADDSWRFYNYSKFWAKHFTWAVTTYSWTSDLYRRDARQPNVIRSQWAANTKLFMPKTQNVLREVPAISFVGNWSRPRAKIVKLLQDREVDVSVFGGAWPQGRRVSEEELLEIFSLSRINLGLNPPPGRASKESIGRMFLKMSINHLVPSFHPIANFKSWAHMNVPQIKARHFQIPACGGFVMTSMADDLHQYYTPGKEIVIYKNEDDMAEKIKYYLLHDAERAAIARAGYERTLRDHTYEKRFVEIFAKIGLEG